MAFVKRCPVTSYRWILVSIFFLTFVMNAEAYDAVVAPGAQVSLSANASDMDCYFPAGACPQVVDDPGFSYIWEAVWEGGGGTPAGTFSPNPPNTQSVIWYAPSTEGVVLIAVTATNTGNDNYPGEIGFEFITVLISSCNPPCTGINEVCCNGECFNYLTHMCCGGKVERQPCCTSFDCKHCVSGTAQPCLRTFPTFEAMSECSNIVANPEPPVEPMDCSSPFGDNPAFQWCGLASSFLQPCINHDICYRTCYGTSIWTTLEVYKNQCDYNFWQDMKNVCEPFPEGTCRNKCFEWADLYYEAVSTWGDDAFKEGQKKYCACCDC